MRLAGAALAAAAALSLGGCGGAVGDLIAVTTNGAGDDHRFVVTGDGRGSCDGRAYRALPSGHVLDAREVERELKKPAKAHAGYSTGAPAGARRYLARTKDGNVTWVEGARATPPVVAKGIALTQELKRDLCPGSESTGP
jgi:hypothetical protein